jgi:hypothetical protein
MSAESAELVASVICAPSFAGARRGLRPPAPLVVVDAVSRLPPLGGVRWLRLGCWVPCGSG